MVSDSKGTRPCPGTLTKLVAVEEKNDWPSDGARKPVLAAPRRMRCVTGSKRTVSLPSAVLPKSL